MFGGWGGGSLGGLGGGGGGVLGSLGEKSLYKESLAEVLRGLGEALLEVPIAH